MPPLQADNSAQMMVDAIRRPSGLAELSLTGWDQLLRLARASNLLGRLAEEVHDAGFFDLLPPKVLPHLASARILVTHQRHAIAAEIGHIGSALGSLKLPLIFLKGAAYAAADLSAARGRLFGDVDILIPKSEINRVEAALMMHGWTSGHTDVYDDRYYRQWMHELPPMVQRNRGTLIDVHHNILPITASCTPSANFLIDDSVALADSQFRVLSPCDMVLHSAVHLFHEGDLRNGLRDLFDIESLIIEFSQRDPDFWSHLTERARKLGLSWPLHYAFRYLRAVLGTAVPSAPAAVAEHDAAKGVLTQSLVDAMYLRSLKPDHPLCSDLATKTARFGIYIRSHALRMPPGLLITHLVRKAFLRTFQNTSRTT